MEIDIALARNRNPLSVTWFEWVVNNTTYIKIENSSGGRL